MTKQPIRGHRTSQKGGVRKISTQERIAAACNPRSAGISLAELYGVRIVKEGKPPTFNTIRSHRRHMRCQPVIKILLIDEGGRWLTIEKLLTSYTDANIKFFRTSTVHLALEAVERHKPTIIIACNWYDKSKMGYLDVMMPIIKAYHDLHVVVLASAKKPGNAQNKDLPIRSSYFHGRAVIETNNAKWQEKLLAEIVETIGFIS